MNSFTYTHLQQFALEIKLHKRAPTEQSRPAQLLWETYLELQCNARTAAEIATLFEVSADYSRALFRALRYAGLISL